mmetsp:Transcript_52447/g.60268  ORF Transcript_52447/g.60268 Transcript_52447/m.60268 type:complete len:214 (+) Transcript_52447:249-890(+)
MNDSRSAFNFAPAATVVGAQSDAYRPSSVSVPFTYTWPGPHTRGVNPACTTEQSVPSGTLGSAANGIVDAVPLSSTRLCSDSVPITVKQLLTAIAPPFSVTTAPGATYTDCTDSGVYVSANGIAAFVPSGNSTTSDDVGTRGVQQAAFDTSTAVHDFTNVTVGVGGAAHAAPSATFGCNAASRDPAHSNTTVATAARSDRIITGKQRKKNNMH